MFSEFNSRDHNDFSLIIINHALPLLRPLP